MGKVAEAPALACVGEERLDWIGRRSCREMMRCVKRTDLLEGMVVLLVVGHGGNRVAGGLEGGRGESEREESRD